MGLFSGNSVAPQVKPDMRELRSDIQNVRSVATTDPTQLQKSGQIQVDQLAKDKMVAQGNLAQQRIGAMDQSNQAMMMTGGASRGAMERGQARTEAAGNVANQQLNQDLTRMQSDVRAADFGAQESFQNQALLATPGMSARPMEIQMQADSANAQAKALTDQANKQKGQGLASILGGAAGFAFGGPAGMSAGAGIGSSLFSAFS